MKPAICLIQPPFVQLNSPYPGIYYLRSFFEGRGYAVSVRDHSIGLFERIFCRAGLEKIFKDFRGMSDTRRVSDAHGRAWGPVVERFLTDEDRWLSSIDRTVAFLRGQDREWGHCISLGNGLLPEGVRFQAGLGELGGVSGNIPPDAAPLLASRLLADIADFITVCLDPNFSLVRYVPSPAASLSAGFRDFHDVQAGLDGYIIKNFYLPFLEDEWKNLDREPGWFSIKSDEAGRTGLFMGLGIPFPGCLTGALACAQSAKAHFGSGLVTAAGGGYVNTELRFIQEEKIFDYFDYLSFDRGYGSLAAILDDMAEACPRQGQALYKTMYRDEKGRIVRDEGIAGGEAKAAGGPGAQSGDSAEMPGGGLSRGEQIDHDAARSVFPDYRGADFSRYICPVDDVNPMHRLWSDGRWLKAYTAHGCYWHNCAFCDVSLDYIRCFEPVDIAALFKHLVNQAEASGVRGVHLVDEACPPASLVQLALLNREAGLPLVFWGNIRFEKAFTPDAAAILAAGGLIGVSAGIEVATEKGFARIGKGIGIADVVNACAAFKEAGILVHAYLIYGYWDEDAGEIIDSAETMRQLFDQGLLDSAFWHKFVLTGHSRIYDEWRRGLHPELKVRGDADNAGLRSPGTPGRGTTDSGKGGEKIFAFNDLSFEGEEQFDRYTAPLDQLLKAWMRGDTADPVSGAFGFRVPEPSIAPDLIIALLDAYARNRDKSRGIIPAGQIPSERALFLGSRPIMHLTEKGAELWWRRRFEDCTLRVKPGRPGAAELETALLEQTAVLLAEAAKAPGIDAGRFYRELESRWGEKKAGQIWKTLRKGGLMLMPAGRV